MSTIEARAVDSCSSHPGLHTPSQMAAFVRNTEHLAGDETGARGEEGGASLGRVDAWCARSCVHSPRRRPSPTVARFQGLGFGVSV